MDTNTFLTALLVRFPVLSSREKIRLALFIKEECVTEESTIKCIKELGPKGIEKIARRRLSRLLWEPELWADSARRDLGYLYSIKARLVSWLDMSYPAILRTTARPPFALYVRGAIPASQGPSLAIVGTRYPTGRGLDCAFALAKEASQNAIEIISGLARGIDTAAHRGSMAGAGKTFAVLGSGIDWIYPASNKALAAKMLELGGGLLSEYPPGVNPGRWTFPERNRILAGLCRSTLVIEAPGASGALISASFALEEGRDVYVAKACLEGSRSAGTDALHADGAMAVSSIAEVLEDWSYAIGSSMDIFEVKEKYSIFCKKKKKSSAYKSRQRSRSCKRAGLSWMSNKEYIK